MSAVDTLTGGWQDDRSEMYGAVWLTQADQLSSTLCVETEPHLYSQISIVHKISSEITANTLYYVGQCS